MVNRQPPEWRALSEIPAELEDLRPSFPAYGEFEDAITNAILSGHVPVRGRPFNEAHPDYDILAARPTSAFKLLAGHIGEGASIKLAENFIGIRSGPLAGTYLRMEADLRAVRKWLSENSVPNGPREKEPERGYQQAIRQAAQELWPGGWHSGLKKTRNDKIREHLSKKEVGKPDDRTIRRAFRGK